MATTSRLSLRYPVASDSADVPRDIGNLASDIDNAAIFSKGTFAARPTSTVGSPGIDGRYYFATDTSRLYLDTGTSWVEVASGNDSVTSAMIATDAVDSAEIKAGAVGTSELASAVGNFGAWTSYTPTLTQSGAVTKTVQTAKYAQIGKTVFVNFYLSVTASGTTNNAVRVGLPVTGTVGGYAFIRIGAGILSDSSTSTSYSGSWYMATSTTVGFIGDWSGTGEWGTTPNLAIASGDELHGTLVYEAA